jgi:hypothetical protein
MMTAVFDKDPAIKGILGRLWSRLGADAFVVVDHWESDLRATGIANSRNLSLLVYISCYGEAPDRFGYELELPPPNGADSTYQVAGRGSDVSFDELAAVVAQHLNL